MITEVDANEGRADGQIISNPWICAYMSVRVLNLIRAFGQFAIPQSGILTLTCCFKATCLNSGCGKADA
jgi:hypothetical protein